MNKIDNLKNNILYRELYEKYVQEKKDSILLDIFHDSIERELTEQIDLNILNTIDGIYNDKNEDLNNLNTLAQNRANEIREYIFFEKLQEKEKAILSFDQWIKKYIS